MRIFNLNKNEHCAECDVSEILGDRGVYLNEMAALGLSISPAFVFDSDIFKSLNEESIQEKMAESIQVIEKITNKKYGSAENPLLLKIVLSPSLKLSTHISIHNLGLNEVTVKGFAKKTTEEFAYHEYWDLIIKFLTLLSKEEKISEAEIEEIKKMPTEDACSSLISKYSDSFPIDVYDQLKQVFLNLRERYYNDKSNEGIPCALVVQGMMFGNYIGDSMSGLITTRDKITGEKVLSGGYTENNFNFIPEGPKTIDKINPKYLDEIEKASDKLEKQFKEIRKIKFAVEESNFWLIDQFFRREKSARAGLKILLDLYKEGVIDENYILNQISYIEIESLLHPEIDERLSDKIAYADVGEMGSTGAAIGKIYFSTEKLLSAYRDANVKGQDTNTILCMPSTYAGDVQAIEIGNGVICSEGGYASHAPVVARSLGKAAILYKDLKIKGDHAIIDGHTVKEGDYVSISVPSFKTPRVYFGQANLIISNPSDNGLIELMSVVAKKTDKARQEGCSKIEILANADTPKDTIEALKFGAEGVGLCRTEHMFFEKERVNYFRALLLVRENKQVREQILAKLKEFQKEDFYDLFKVLDGKVLTVRLLDAPLHEFIPTKEEEFSEVKNLLKEYKIEEEIDIKFELAQLQETNPMLGNRGCRFGGVVYPDIYQMQESALLEAAFEFYLASKDKNKIQLKIMFPLVSIPAELQFLINGKNIEGTVVPGLKGVEQEILKKYDFKKLPFEYEIGVMIELPSAALVSSILAQSVSFFSFGTNDLTQTLHGLSRDDITSFYPSYTQYDLVAYNPFIRLSAPVKELLLYSTNSGRMARPELKVSVCGEQGANFKDIEFSIKSNFTSVSCSTFRVPLAKLAVAKSFIKKQETFV